MLTPTSYQNIKNSLFGKNVPVLARSSSRSLRRISTAAINKIVCNSPANLPQISLHENICKPHTVLAAH